MLPSMHDDLIVGYEVDCDRRTIKFRTRRPNWAQDQTIRNTIFRGVVGYHFKDDAFSNIIMAVEYVPIEKFVQEYRLELSVSFREAGALDAWTQSDEASIEALVDAGVNAIVISSSMGLSGWILAKQLEFASQE